MKKDKTSLLQRQSPGEGGNKSEASQIGGKVGRESLELE